MTSVSRKSHAPCVDSFYVHSTPASVLCMCICKCNYVLCTPHALARPFPRAASASAPVLVPNTRSTLATAELCPAGASAVSRSCIFAGCCVFAALTNGVSDKLQPVGLEYRDICVSVSLQGASRDRTVKHRPAMPMTRQALLGTPSTSSSRAEPCSTGVTTGGGSYGLCQKNHRAHLC